MDIKLYYHPKTRAFRVRWLLEELGLDYEIQYVDLFGGEGNSPAYKKIHPHGCLPALEVNGHVMFETSAICHWLTDQFPDKGLAPPMDDPARMLYTQWMYYVPATIEPPLWYEFLHSKILPAEQRVPAIMPFLQQRYTDVFEVLNEAYKDKAHLINGRFSTVDLMIGSMLPWKIKEVSHYPELKRLLQDVTQRSAFRRAKAEIAEQAVS